MDKKTKAIFVRISESEYRELKAKAPAYGSISECIRVAIREMTDVTAKHRLNLIKELGSYYRNAETALNRMAGNLNQALKRANELNAAGLMTPQFYNAVVIPAIQSAQAEIAALKRTLYDITQLAMKIKAKRP